MTHLLRRVTATAFAATALALPALALASPAQAAAGNQADQAWLVTAHQSNLAEIAAGKDAQKNATDDGITDLGEMLVADHTTLDTTIKKLAEKYDVSLPSGPSAAQKAALASVKQNSGAAYDKAWVRAQTTGHLQTKAAGQRELSAGSAADVLTADRTSAPVVQKHINELSGLAGDLGISVPTSVSAGTGGQAAAGPDRALAAGVTGVGVVCLAGAALVVRRRRLVTVK